MTGFRLQRHVFKQKRTEKEKTMTLEELQKEWSKYNGSI